MFAPSGTSSSLMGNVAFKSEKCHSSVSVASCHSFLSEYVKACLYERGYLYCRYLLFTLIGVFTRRFINIDGEFAPVVDICVCDYLS